MAAPASVSRALARPGIVRRVLDALFGRGGERVDSWKNFTTGAGTYGRDKTQHTFMDGVRILQWGECESLYYGDWVSARIIDGRPKEYFRRGFNLPEGNDDLETDLKRLDVRAKFRDAIRWARIWGGAGVVCNVDDGLTVDQPVNLARARGVKWMNVVDRRYLNPIDYYDDPSQANFGQPRTYMVTPAFGQSATGAIVHESRVIRFLGTDVDPITARRLAGWSYSALQRPYDVVRRIAQTYQAAAQLMYDAGQGVLKISNLFDGLSGPNQAAYLDRIAQADMSRWAGRPIAVDKEGEEFGRAATPLAGIPDMMDRLFLELGGAAEMPLTRIFGRSPAGQNATGESDDRMWYESIGSEQKNIVEPGLVKLLMMLTGGKWDGELEWLGLERPNDLVEAQVNTERAKYWQLLENVGAVSGEQIALVELAEKPVEDVLDVATLEKLVKEEYEAAKAPPQLPPPPMVTGVDIPKGSLLSHAVQGQQPGAPAPKQLPPAGGHVPPPPPATGKGDAPAGLTSKQIADQVFEQLLDDYSEDAAGWVKDPGVTWSGPKAVPLDQIDFSGRKRWRASKEPEKVKAFAKKQKKGKLKPIILVKTPDSDKLKVPDGHHRLLAAEALDRPVMAYVGTVTKDAGPWDEMHASQRGAPSLDSRSLVERILDFAAVASGEREDHIVERGGKFYLMSMKDPSKQLGGPYESREQAAEREREILAAEAAKGG